MDIEIGVIKSITGTATANTTQGVVRNLHIDEYVYANELITTDLDSLISIEFIDGSVINLNSNSQLALDSSVFDPTTDTAANEDLIQQAILAGLDPTQVAEATAAGAGTQSSGNEGHSPVYVNYLAPEVVPESGFDTTGISVAFPEVLEELQSPVDKPEISVDTPLISIIIDAEGGSATEGENVTFTVSQDLVSNEDTTVTVEILSLSNDSATEGQDYELIDTITIVIPAGFNIAGFDVATHIDNLQESSETFSARIVSASNPSGTVNIATAVATGTILDNYLPPEVSISTGIEGGSAIEGENVTFTVSQDLVSNEDTAVTVEILSLSSDSATEGQDYELIDTVTIIIPAGANIAGFDVATHIDSLQEGNETFSARIVSASNPNGTVDIATAVATGTILDNYLPPEVSISTGIEGGSAIEGENVTFTVSQDLISNEDTAVTVEILSLSSDSATEGQDYELIDTVTIIIPAGANIAGFDVATHIDSLQEGSETFSARIVSASNPNGTVDIATAVATGTILDDYDSPMGGDTIHLNADESLIVDTVVDNSLTFTAGTADLTEFKFDTDLSSLKLDTNEDGLDDVSWYRINNTEIEGRIGSSVAVTLTLTASTITAGATADVTVQAVLDDAFKHLSIPGRNPLDLGYITVTASTAAGDDVVGTAYMAVIDDIIEITSLSNANLVNAVGAEAMGNLVIDAGEDGLASLTFTGTVPLGLMTSNGHEVSYQPQTDGSLQAIDENNDIVFSLSQNDTGDGYTLALDQLLQGPIVETTVSLTGSAVDAGAPVGAVTQVNQNGIIINLSATDSSGPDLINASNDGYGVDNGLVDEGDSETVIITLDDPNGTFSEMSVTVGNFSITGNSTDIYSYQLYLDGNVVGNTQSVSALATNSSTNTTISINGSDFDEIRMWATHSGGNTQSEGNYKIISVDTDVSATSYEDLVLNFGVDAIDTDGDFHGGDFQIAVDINGDSGFLLLDDPSLDSLINEPIDEPM